MYYTYNSSERETRWETVPLAGFYLLTSPETGWESLHSTAIFTPPTLVPPQVISLTHKEFWDRMTAHGSLLLCALGTTPQEYSSSRWGSLGCTPPTQTFERFHSLFVYFQVPLLTSDQTSDRPCFLLLFFFLKHVSERESLSESFHCFIPDWSKKLAF